MLCDAEGKHDKGKGIKDKATRLRSWDQAMLDNFA